MSFMKPEIWFGQYYEVSANHGETTIVPADVVGPVATHGDLQLYVEGTVDDPDEPAILQAGWLARLSAPGYLDCTECSTHATEAIARAYLDDLYGDLE